MTFAEKFLKAPAVDVQAKIEQLYIFAETNDDKTFVFADGSGIEIDKENGEFEIFDPEDSLGAHKRGD